MYIAKVFYVARDHIEWVADSQEISKKLMKDE